MTRIPAYLAMLVLVALTTLQPALARPRLTVETPLNGSTVNGPIVLTGTATPNSVVEVRGTLNGTTQVGSNGRWSIALDPGNRVGRNVNLTVRALGPWGDTSHATRLSYAISDHYRPTAYYDSYYYNAYPNPRTVQDSLTDPYYDYYVDPYTNSYTYTPTYQTNYYATSPYVTAGRSLRLSVNSPTNGSSMRGNFVLAGTGTPGAQVVVTGTMNGTTTVNGNGRWSLPMTLRGYSPGTVINLTAFARDQFGNQSPATQLKYAVRY